MTLLPKVNLRRTLLIARRDYLGYVKTWGFWISFLLPFIFGAFGIFMAQADLDFSPTQYVTVIDETGHHKDRLIALHQESQDEIIQDILETKSLFIQDKDKRDEFRRILRSNGSKAGVTYLETHVPELNANYEAPSAKLTFIPPPADSLAALLPYLRGDKFVDVKRKPIHLEGVILFKPGQSADRPQTEYWSIHVNKFEAPSLVNRYLRRLARTTYLDSKGLSVDELDRRVANAPKASLFNPVKTDSNDQGVNSSDTVPYVVATILAGMLWLTVFSGAYMLLTSLLEEKLNKLLEMMLATTRFSEIILGKLLGVAALTLSMMAPYILLGVFGVIGYIMAGPDQDIAKGLVSAFNAKMITFLIIYLILGYILYGAFFIALGSLSSSMQDAQTLTTPILFILMACLIVIPLGITAPDSPILRIATFIPFSAPFAAIVRLPSDPPLWEMLLSTVFLAALCMGTIAMAGRIFRFGVLSGAGMTVISTWFKRVILRRKA